VLGIIFTKEILMINMKLLPQDCSAETLFTEPEELLKYSPDLYALQYMGQLGYLKVDVWAITYDPCEFNTRRPDGTIDHDYYICLCEWWDGSPTTFRYRTTEVYPIREE